MHNALFLDRDGVICEAMPEGEYLTSWKQFRFLDGVHELVRMAKEKGYKIVVVTNQSPVAKGFMTTETLEGIHERMNKELGGHIERTYYCPHEHNEGCVCRKPSPGMLVQAAKDFDIDLSQSFIVGDRWKEVEAGKAAGVKTIFLKNHQNNEDLTRSLPDVVISNLREVIPLL